MKKKVAKVTKPKTKKSTKKKQKGFTLIELLVVVAIVGILSAIAIPQFAAYRARAFNARVESDLRNAASAQESYFIDNSTYTMNVADLVAAGLAVSDGVTLTVTSANATAFVITSSHGSATTSCTWDSTASPNMTCT
jgi:prepilin-type N-terminal cleavage/methylation domain-containing protein